MFGSALTGDVRRHGVGGWRSAVVSQADKQNAHGLWHQWTIQAVGVKRRNRRLLVTTKMLDEAIAALATTGATARIAMDGPRVPESHTKSPYHSERYSLRR